MKQFSPKNDIRIYIYIYIFTSFCKSILQDQDWLLVIDIDGYLLKFSIFVRPHFWCPTRQVEDAKKEVFNRQGAVFKKNNLKIPTRWAPKRYKSGSNSK